MVLTAGRTPGQRRSCVTATQLWSEMAAIPSGGIQSARVDDRTLPELALEHFPVKAAARVERQCGRIQSIDVVNPH